MKPPLKRPPVRMPSVAEDRAITAAAKALISVRYSPEVVSYFKSTGEGWQSRMDGVLKEYVERHSMKSVGDH